MYFVNGCRKSGKIKKSFKRAQDLEEQALNASSNGQSSMEYYTQAYEIYISLVENNKIPVEAYSGPQNPDNSLR